MPGVMVSWIPSHLTCAEFEAKGHPRHAWSGNNAADEAAKERANMAIAPDEPSTMEFSVARQNSSEHRVEFYCAKFGGRPGTAVESSFEFLGSWPRRWS